MSENPNEKEDLRRIDDAVKMLTEHFDAIQVFVTRHESGELGGTVRVSKGVGNWYARYGQIKHWIIVEEHASRLSVKPDGENEE